MWVLGSGRIVATCTVSCVVLWGVGSQTRKFRPGQSYQPEWSGGGRQLPEIERECRADVKVVHNQQLFCQLFEMSVSRISFLRRISRVLGAPRPNSSKAVAFSVAASLRLQSRQSQLICSSAPKRSFSSFFDMSAPSSDAPKAIVGSVHAHVGWRVHYFFCRAVKSMSHPHTMFQMLT